MRVAGEKTFRLYVYAENPELSVEEVTSEDREKALLFIENSLKSLGKIVEKKTEGGEDQIGILTDLLVITLKSPFYTDPVEVEEFSETNYLSPFNYFLSLYLVYRLRKFEEVWRIIDETVFKERNLSHLLELKFTGQLIKSIWRDEGFRTNLLDIMKETIREDSTYWSLFKIPQDTRPGFNTGLVPHMLLTSAIAWALLEEKGEELRILPAEGRSAIIRISAILHDVGKIIDPRNHVVAGISFLEEITRETGYTVFSRIKSLVEKHHREEGPLTRLISISDRIASAIDRNREVVLNILKDSKTLREKAPETDLERLYGFGRESWKEYYKLVEKNALYDLTKEYFTLLKERKESIIEKSVSKLEEGDIYYAIVDIGGIQSLIQRGALLHTMVGASFLIDLIATTLVPFFLIKELDVPPEIFITSSGGVITFILPRKKVEDARKCIKDLENLLRNTDIPLRLAFYAAPLAKVYYRDHGELVFETFPIASIIDNIRRQKLLDKYSIGQSGSVFDLGLILDEKPPRVVSKVVCRSCGLEPATIYLKKKDLKLCKVCKRLYSIGEELVFKGKYVTKVKIRGVSRTLGSYIAPGLKGDKKEWTNLGVGEHILEFIAGHKLVIEKNRGELEFSEKHSMNIAVIAADGDRMGKFFGESLSLAELHEKSLVTDLALKRALRRFIAEIISTHNSEEGEREVARVLFGYLYMGGDDMLAIVPAYLALPYSLKLMEVFNEVLRGRTISIGIASAKFRHPIWHLISAARFLEGEAKKKSPISLGKSSVVFLYIDQGLLSELTAENILRSYREKYMSAQPYSDDLLLFAACKMIGVNETRLKELLGTLLKEREAGLKLEDMKKIFNHYRNSWNKVLEIFGELLEKIGYDYSPKLVKLALMRDKERIKESEKYFNSILEILDGISNSLRRECNPIADLYMLYKLMGGGLL